MPADTTLFQEDPFLAACNVVILLQTFCIALPIAIYCSVNLYRNRNTFFMEKRGVILIVCTCLVTVEGQLLVPEVARQKVLENLHRCHPGKPTMLANARHLH